MRNVRAKAIQCIIDEVGANMTPAVVIQWELETGDFRRSTHWLSDAAMPYTAKALANAGFTGRDPSVLDGADKAKCEKLLPSQVLLVLEDEVSEKDGKTYEQVKFVNKVGGPELKRQHQMDSSSKADIAARFARAQDELTQPNNERAEMADAVNDDSDPFEDNDFSNI